MARIRDIRLISLAFQMPQIKAYGMARRLVASRGATLVEVETEDGVVGIGEAGSSQGRGRLSRADP